MRVHMGVYVYVHVQWARESVNARGCERVKACGSARKRAKACERVRTSGHEKGMCARVNG